MTHREKVRHLIADLRGRGVNSFTTAPPIYRLLWLLGSKVTPPHFQSPGAVSLLLGSVFGFAGIVVIRLWSGSQEDHPLWMLCLYGIFMGAIFGRLMARRYQRTSSELNLPSWENYPSA
jgi:hypothetical protein